jgi:hypothetical protein
MLTSTAKLDGLAWAVIVASLLSLAAIFASQF